jgi:hypothetical protein
MTIILYCGRKCWWAKFQEFKVHLPLAFKPETKFYTVYESMKARYPDAVIGFERIEIEEGEAGCILR